MHKREVLHHDLNRLDINATVVYTKVSQSKRDYLNPARNTKKTNLVSKLNVATSADEIFMDLQAIL